MSAKVPPEVLMYKLDDWKDGDPKTNDFNPGKLDGKTLVLIALQKERRLLKRIFHPTKNWIYRIGDRTDLVVYKPFPKAAGVIPMGISMTTMWWHPKSVPMETYCERFITMPDKEWLAMNDFVLV